MLDRVFALVYRQMHALTAGASPDFDDLVQTAAEQALRSLGSFQAKSKLSTWTYRICYRTLTRSQRWYRRWARRFSLTAAGELPHKASPEPTGAHAVELLEQAHRLRRHISRLSHKHRAAVVLCDLEGFSVDEAATIAGIKVATLRSRLRDGRRDLRSMLERDPYFSRPPIAGVVK